MQCIIFLTTPIEQSFAAQIRETGGLANLDRKYVVN